MEIYLWGVKPTTAHIIGKGAGLAYYGMRKLHRHMKDTRYDPGGAANRQRVPGTPEYDALNAEQKTTAYARYRTGEAFRDNINPMGSYLRQVPIPYLRGYIRNRVEPDYHRRFDPYKRVKYVESTTGPQAMEEPMWVARQIIQGAQD